MEVFVMTHIYVTEEQKNDLAKGNALWLWEEFIKQPNVIVTAGPVVQLDRIKNS